MHTVSEAQGQANTGPERTINKSASTPFIGASQPYNRLGWNADISGQAKSKQEEVCINILFLFSVIQVTPIHRDLGECGSVIS